MKTKALVSLRDNAADLHLCLLIQLLKAYRIKFQKFAAHAHKDALINETNSVLYQLNCVSFFIMHVVIATGA